MRVTIICPSLDLGGAQRSLVKLANLIQPSVEQVAIISLAGADRALLQELHERVSVTCLNARSSANPLLWFRVGILLAMQKPTVVIGWSTYANLVAIVCTRLLRGCAVVLSERNYVPRVFARSRTTWLRRRLVIRLMRWFYGKADIVTANSAANLRLLRRFVGRGPRYALLPNVIDVEDAGRRAGHDVPVSLNGIDGTRILGLGRLHHQKGFDILLKAFEAVRAREKWTLVIAGEGPDREALQLQARALGVGEAVRWIGSVSNPFPYYRWADIVVVSSRFEGFPNVPLEAMALGRAVICSDCETGPREVAGGGRYARLVPAEDAKALADAILELGRDPGARESLGASARAHILANYDVGMMRHRYLEILGLHATDDQSHRDAA